MRKKLLTPNEAARLLMVAPVTVRQWAQKGLLAAHTTAGGHRRFSPDAVRAFAARMGMALDEDVLIADAGAIPRKPELDASRVLVVDDDRQFAGFLVALFGRQFPGIHVDVANDGFDAGRQVQRGRPHLVLLDVMMPGIDGVEVCRRLKADPQTATTRVLAMTGHHSAELERRIREAGAECLLRKPFSTADLLSTCGPLGTPAVARTG
jgi:excisionase family DNA binding protein